MASYLQIENISKSYGAKILFDHIGFNINEGDKYALVAPNGTGKTSLMRIIAGKDKSDSGGKITFLKDIRIAFLEQEYSFEPGQTVWERLKENESHIAKGSNGETVKDYEREAIKIMTEFGLNEPDKMMGELSGGQIKRVALTEMLASGADFYIMDEPTNHLDIDAIEYLENFLSHSRCTLLMVTHDRYFLDKVCNIVMEMDHGKLYSYKGNYRNYLEKRQERIENYNSETDKVKNILRRELEWMRSTPQARTGKAKYRIDAFHDLKDRAGQVLSSSKLDMSDVKFSTHLGNKIIDCKDVCFSYGDKCLLNHFTYNFQRYEKVGIVGKNGSGKTTFINILAGETGEDGTLTGSVERGESVRIGYYHQEGINIEEDRTVLETVNDTGLLNRFMFPHDMLNNKISSLSGGEKRRLYLLTVLMRKPNLLILDEPTNDLDIVTLDILEEYLQEFEGTLIIISHDRHFLDRLADHLFIFCGNGEVKDFIGDYSGYRAFIKEVEKKDREEKRLSQRPQKETSCKRGEQDKPGKLSFKEKKELEHIEEELKMLNSEKSELESSLAADSLDYEYITKASQRLAEINETIDVKETRWLELSI
ncbi:MAG: ABC-F family ATP-binding cassette domain-containing protein [Bacteroidales bacterium]|jgi:ATP-binding cassette subfamily F protein uup|nr:ABC-F family ATP-binding cassette domain-containing protein [Bacteroidales bacterium]